MSDDAGNSAGPPADPTAARLRELRALAAGGATPRELAIHLAALGYDQERAAVLLDRLTGSDEAADRGGDPGVAAAGPGSSGAVAAPDPEPAAAPIRVWAPFERARFTPEAWGQLLRLRADGLSDGEFEHLVDRALLQLDGPVGVTELRALLGDAAPPDPGPPTLH